DDAVFCQLPFLRACALQQFVMQQRHPFRRNASNSARGSIDIDHGEICPVTHDIDRTTRANPFNLANTKKGNKKAGIKWMRQISHGNYRRLVYMVAKGRPRRKRYLGSLCDLTLNALAN